MGTKLSRADRKLTPKTKRQILTILRKSGDDQLHLPALLGPVGSPQPTAAAFAEATARMATWPDQMPGGKGKTGPWHFTNFGLFEGTTLIW